MSLFLCQVMFLIPDILPETAFSSDQYIVKFAAVAPEGSTWIKRMRELDKALREKSKGEIGFNIYAGGIAGDELDVLKKIRIGQLHCSAFSGVGLSHILPMVRVLDLPFLFRSYEEVDRVHKELTPYFQEQFRHRGFEFLTWAEVGNIYIFSKKPIGRMADLTGLKIWTWAGDPISKETFSMMGTNPIPLSVTDVTTALNTGMIDTFYAPPLGALALQWHTSVKHMMSLPLAHATGVVLIASNFYNKIPANLSDILKVEIERIMADLTLDLRKQTQESIRLLQEGGLEVMPMPSQSDLQAFYQVHTRVAQRLAGQVYPKDLLDRVYDILKRAR